MRKSRKEAAETRERIVKMAAREFNESGIQATGLAEIMAAAGLTHGGFYKHFSSKDQLVGEGGEQNAPLGRAVIGGLLCATVATLLFVPVVFSYAAVAPYRQASLTAFQEVEDNVTALRILENETQQQQQAVASAQESLQRFTNRYKGGVDTYLQVITAQTIELANERNAIDIQRRRLDASVLLVQSTGRRVGYFQSSHIRSVFRSGLLNKQEEAAAV